MTNDNSHLNVLSLFDTIFDQKKINKARNIKKYKYINSSSKNVKILEDKRPIQRFLAQNDQK